MPTEIQSRRDKAMTIFDAVAAMQRSFLAPDVQAERRAADVVASRFQWERESATWTYVDPAAATQRSFGPVEECPNCGGFHDAAGAPLG